MTFRKTDLHKKAAKTLSSLPAKHGKQIAQRLVALQTDVRPHDSEKLTGSELYRIDVGEYRIVYEWDDETIRVPVIDKRNDGEAYKKLRRR